MIKFARRCTAVRYVSMDAVVGVPLEYAYELAAGFLEVHPKTVSRWFRGFRSKQYFVHMTGEMKSKLVNEFPPCQLSGSQPVVFCTPEAIEEARQHVYTNDVRREDFQKWLNNELLTHEVTPKQDATIRECVNLHCIDKDKLENGRVLLYTAMCKATMCACGNARAM